MCRNNAHDVVLKNACDLTSDAPALDPSRLVSSLVNNLRMSILQELLELA